MYGIVIIEMILVFSNVCGKQRRYRRTEHPIRKKLFSYLDKVSDSRLTALGVKKEKKMARSGESRDINIVYHVINSRFGFRHIGARIIKNIGRALVLSTRFSRTH